MEGRHEDDADTAKELEDIFKVKTFSSSLQLYQNVVYLIASLLYHCSIRGVSKVYQPVRKGERSAVGFEQTENSSIEQNAKEILLLVDQFYKAT